MLPVVDRGKLDRLIGVVSVEEILRAYRRAGLAEPETAEVYIKAARNPEASEPSAAASCVQQSWMWLGTAMLKLETLRSAQELDRLKSRWTWLEKQCDCTSFQSYELNRRAAQWFAARETPQVIVAESDSGMAIIPAVRRERELGLIGETLFDYRDVLSSGDPPCWSGLAGTGARAGVPLEVTALRGPAGAGALAEPGADGILQCSDDPPVRSERNRVRCGSPQVGQGQPEIGSRGTAAGAARERAAAHRRMDLSPQSRMVWKERESVRRPASAELHVRHRV